MHILITRPKEDAGALAATLTTRGIEVTVEPLLTIQPAALPPIDLTGVQALLFTSANGVRCFAAANSQRNLKVFAVGDSSAQAAKNCGFKNIESASGDVVTLAALVTKRLNIADGALLHAAGSSLAGDLKGQLEAAGFSVRRISLYDSVPATELSPGTLVNLRLGGIDAIVLFSPRSARTFAELWQKADGEKGGLRNVAALCLSAAVAQEVKHLDWQRVEVATRPDTGALLALIDQEQQRKTQMSHPATEVKDDSMLDKPKKIEIDEKVRAAAASDAAAGAAIVAAMPKPASTNQGGVLLLALIAGAAAGVGAIASEPYWRDLLPISATTSQTTTSVIALQDEVAELRQTLNGRDIVDTKARQDIEALHDEFTRLTEQLAENTRTSANTSQQIDLGPLEKRLANLEAQFNSIPAQNQDAPNTPTIDIDALTTRITELEGRLAGLGNAATRLDLLSSETAIQKAEMEAAKTKLDNVMVLGDRLAALENQSKSLGNDIANLSQENAEIVLKRQRAAALVLSIGQLRSALSSAAPFAAELAATKDLSSADEDIAQKLKPTLEVLNPFANQGILTLAQLQATFPAQEIAQGAAIDSARNAIGTETPWLQQTFSHLSELVTVRPVGEVDGDGALAHLARGEARLNSGDLTSAVNEIKTLSGEAGSAAKAWLQNAQARLTVDASGADLAAISAEVLAPKAATTVIEPSN